MLNLHNFAQATVSTGYDAAATSIVLTTGHGARFPASGPFRGTWWNQTDYPNPADDPNREIVEVTARSTDTLTITRGMETAFGGLAASTKNTGGKTYGFALVHTADGSRNPSFSELCNGLDDTHSVTPYQIGVALAALMHWNVHRHGTTTVTGSASVGGANSTGRDIATGVTAGSTAFSAYSDGGNQYFEVSRFAAVTWNRPFIIAFNMSVSSRSTNGVARVGFGKTSATIGDPTSAAVGIKLDSTGAWKGFVHDGTTYAEVAISPSLNSARFVIVSNNGTVDFYSANSDATYTLLGSSTGGPTTGVSGYFWAEATNASDSAQTYLRVKQPKLVAI